MNNSTLSITASRGHIPSLDGLRALSITLVLVGHFFLGELGGVSSIGVYIFFVISGFLITRLLIAEIKENKSLNIPAFYGRRFIRLYPVLIVYILVVCAFSIAFGIPTPPIEIAAVFFYFVNYLKAFYELGGHQHILPIGILWSLSVEEHFYFIAPLFIAAVRGNPRKIAWFAGTVCIASLAIRFTYIILWPELANTNRIYMASETRFDSIAFGVLFAAICEINPNGTIRRIICSRKALIGGVGLLLLSLVIRDGFFRDTIRYTVRSVGALLIVAPIVFSSDLKMLQKIANLRPVTWVGRISYSLYIWHGAAYFFGSNLGIPDTFLMSLFEITITFALATASYYLVEMPFLRLKRYFPTNTRRTNNTLAHS